MLPRLTACLIFGVLLLAVKTFVAILLVYVQYFPADFDSEFLAGRADYFWSGYHIAFYAHVTAGPVACVTGSWLVWSGWQHTGRGSSSSGYLSKRVPWHGRLGTWHIILVVGVVAPSGAVMSAYTPHNSVAAVGFFALALSTGVTAIYGWRTAVCQRFSDHRDWMMRCTLLLFSALVLRVMGGLATWLQADVDLAYAASAWGSWCIPWLSFEAWRYSRLVGRQGMQEKSI